MYPYHGICIIRITHQNDSKINEKGTYTYVLCTLNQVYQYYCCTKEGREVGHDGCLKTHIG